MTEKDQYSSGENGKGKKKGENPGNWDQKLNQSRTKTPEPTSHLSMERTDSLWTPEELYLFNLSSGSRH